MSKRIWDIISLIRNTRNKILKIFALLILIEVLLSLPLHTHLALKKGDFLSNSASCPPNDKSSNNRGKRGKEQCRGFPK